MDMVYREFAKYFLKLTSYLIKILTVYLLIIHFYSLLFLEQTLMIKTIRSLKNLFDKTINKSKS